MREHNRIVKILHDLGFKGDFYQEARRIVGAEMQNIVYDQYLTVLLGKDIVDKYRLLPNLDEDKYNPEVDPSIRNRWKLDYFFTINHILFCYVYY